MMPLRPKPPVHRSALPACVQALRDTGADLWLPPRHAEPVLDALATVSGLAMTLMKTTPDNDDLRRLHGLACDAEAAVSARLAELLGLRKDPAFQLSVCCRYLLEALDVLPVRFADRTNDQRRVFDLVAAALTSANLAHQAAIEQACHAKAFSDSAIKVATLELLELTKQNKLSKPELVEALRDFAKKVNP